MISFRQTISSIIADARRYNHWYKEPGFWVTLSYRVRRLRKYGHSLFLLLIPIDVIFGMIRYIISDTKLAASIEMGEGLKLPHPNGVILHSRIKCGTNVTIFQQVTIGAWSGGTPIISDDTSIYGGAKLFGGISIGANCSIGANTVISIDIPDNSILSVQHAGIRQRPTGE